MRIEGRRNGQNYEIVQGGAVLKSVTAREALNDGKLMAAIDRNKWQPVVAEGEVLE